MLAAAAQLQGGWRSHRRQRYSRPSGPRGERASNQRVHSSARPAPLRLGRAPAVERQIAESSPWFTATAPDTSVSAWPSLVRAQSGVPRTPKYA